MMIFKFERVVIVGVLGMTLGVACIVWPKNSTAVADPNHPATQVIAEKVKTMQVTVVTLCRSGSTDHYINVALGLLTADQKRKIADSYNLQSSDDGDPDSVGFCVCDVSDVRPSQATSIYKDGYIGGDGREQGL